MKEYLISIGAVAIFIFLFLLATKPPEWLLTVSLPDWWPIAAIAFFGLGFFLFLKKIVGENEENKK